MKEKIHKFQQNGMYILLDINSGAVHVIDKMIYDMDCTTIDVQHDIHTVLPEFMYLSLQLLFLLLPII